MQKNLQIPQESLAEFCRRHHIGKLSLFGSILSEDFHAESNIDILVEFEPMHTPGLIRLAKIEMELSAMLGNRNVDVRTPDDLSRYFRAEVLKEAEVQYAQR